MKDKLKIVLPLLSTWMLLIIILLVASCGASVITTTETASVTITTKSTTTTTLVTVTTITTIASTTITPLEVLIPDANLEAAISEEFQISDRPILVADLEILTSLEAPGRFISNLTGLEYCTRLQILAIPQNSVSDLSPLNGLPLLEIINLNRNNISDITPLVENRGLSEGDKVYIENNALDLNEGSEDMVNIKILQDRGVTVYY